MPDVLDVPAGPGDHRPHRDYGDTRPYCAVDLEPWPCRAHRVQRIKESTAKLREILSPEDRRAIAEGARQAHREDFPENFQ